MGESTSRPAAAHGADHATFRHSYSKDKAHLVRRLSRIEGQVRGIARMIEREEYCVDILQQTAALRAALDAVSILILIMTIIVPKFQEIFKSFGTDLPILTTMLISVATGMQKYLPVILLVPVAVYVFFKLLKRTRGGRYFMDNVKLHLPIFGAIVSKSTVSRFARTLGTLIASGVPILEALNIVRETTGNEVIARAIGKVHDSIREGDTIAEPLRASGVVDEIVVNMIDVGEETGELDKMLIKVADNYDDEVDTLVASMMSLLEPLIIVFLGGAVAFIVISLFLPLVELMTSVGQQAGG